jgi:hypothetical protein
MKTFVVVRSNYLNDVLIRLYKYFTSTYYFALAIPIGGMRHNRRTLSCSLIIIYKVVQIWPGRFVCKQVTVCPGHIWTTLYKPGPKIIYFVACLSPISRSGTYFLDFKTRFCKHFRTSETAARLKFILTNYRRTSILNRCRKNWIFYYIVEKRDHGQSSCP